MDTYKKCSIKNINGIDSLVEEKNGFGVNDYTQFNKDGTGYSAFGIPDVSDADFTYQGIERAMENLPINYRRIP